MTTTHEDNPDVGFQTKGDPSALWKAVCKTPTEFTESKDIPGKGPTQTVKPHYFFQKATEVFGPIGMGWGAEQIESKYINGHPILDGKGNAIGTQITHVLRVKVWAYIDGKRAEVFGTGSTVFVSQYGTTDGDAEKKSFTDAVKKALTHWGFCADIWLGLFDNHSYVAQRTLDSEVAATEERNSAYERDKKEVIVWAEEQAKSYALIPNVAALKAAKNKHLELLSKKAAAAHLTKSDYQIIAGGFEKHFNTAADKIAPVCMVACQNKHCHSAGMVEEARLNSKCGVCGTPRLKALESE